MARRTKEEAELTRQALMNAALKVFSRQGYAATRLEDIAEEAGVTRGAIYWHFKSKADLYAELQARSAEKLFAVIRSAVEAGGTALDILRRVMVTSWQYIEEDEEFRAVQELTLLKTELLPELQAGMEQKIQGMADQSEQLRVAFEEAKAAGELALDIDVKDAVIAYSAFLNGLVMMWMLNPQGFSIRARAEALADVFMRGLRS